MKGLPAEWMHVKDELYQQLRGPAENIEILATAFADEKFKGSGRDEPILFTVSYGAGRIFHTVMGHAGTGDKFFPAMECAGFITTLQRGAEWAATGKVTQKIPEGLPGSSTSVQWKYFERMDIDVIKERIADYEIGKSTNCFIALNDLISENSGEAILIAEYHKAILAVLKSASASIEGKKILLKNYSWMATQDYQPVYEKLSADENLKDEALFAQERLNY